MAHCRKGDESEYRAVAVGYLSRWCFACIMRQLAASCTFMQKATQHMLPKFATFKADDMVSSGRLLKEDSPFRYLNYYCGRFSWGRFQLFQDCERLTRLVGVGDIFVTWRSPSTSMPRFFRQSKWWHHMVGAPTIEELSVEVQRANTQVQDEIHPCKGIYVSINLAGPGCKLWYSECSYVSFDKFTSRV